jgi:uncharacterized protein
MSGRDSLELGSRDGAVRITVHVKPRASKSRILGVRAGALEVAVAAPPVDGAANAELVRILAAALGVSKGALRIAGGEHGKKKLVDVTGLDAATVRARLEPGAAASRGVR